jgi:hypothetical protein
MILISIAAFLLLAVPGLLLTRTVPRRGERRYDAAYERARLRRP